MHLWNINKILNLWDPNWNLIACTDWNEMLILPLKKSPLLFKTLILVWYEGPFYLKLYFNVVVKIMPNHTIFSLHNVNLMRHESNHFATMNAVMYFNQSDFSNSINFYCQWLFAGFTFGCINCPFWGQVLWIFILETIDFLKNNNSKKKKMENYLSRIPMGLCR